MNSELWNPDNGDGTYSNPVIYADYSDPDAIRVGVDYYLVASSFSNVPGIPVLHSTDLVNWELINYVLKELPDPRYDEPVHGCGVWAPSVRFHDGLFYVCFPMPDEGIYMCSARDPRGEWSSPVNIRPGAGWIDPCPFWDDDGRAYLVAGVAKSRIGYKSVLHIQEMKPDGSGLIGEPVKVFDGNENGQHTIEGPKLYKREGLYYIFAPAGGVKTGWQTVLRSDKVFGPYEHKVVMRQGDTEINGPHQGAWVDTVTGEDWFLHFQDVYAAGRIVHLQPMIWREGWPVIGEPAEGADYGVPVGRYRKPGVSAAGQQEDGRRKAGSLSEMKKEARQQTEGLQAACQQAAGQQAAGLSGFGDFRGITPGLQWQWNANPKKDWYRISGDRLILRAVKQTGAYGDAPNLLLRKWEAPEFSCVIQLNLSGLKPGDKAGVISMGMEYGLVSFSRTETSIKVTAVCGRQRFGKILVEETDERKEEITELPAETGTVCVRYEVKRVGKRDLSPEERGFPRERVSISFGAEAERIGGSRESENSKDTDSHERSEGFECSEGFIAAVEMDAVPGRWTGVKYGVFCLSENENSNGNVAVECVWCYD